MARKRRKKDVPAKGRLRDFADKLWSLAVKDDWGCKCAICGRRGSGPDLTKGLNSHHLVPRQHKATRYVLENGICLCRPCHVFDANHSPHQHPAGFLEWLEKNHPSRIQWLRDNVHPRFDGVANEFWYIDQIVELALHVDEEDLVQIIGVKFHADTIFDLVESRVAQLDATE